MGDHVWAHCPTINASMIISAFIVKMQKVLILLLVLREHLTAFLKFASLCNYIYRTKKSTSATDRSETDWSSLLQSSSCYIVAWHSIGAALFVCTVIWWETRFLSLSDWTLAMSVGERWKGGGGVGGSEVFLQGLKLASPTHCELYAWNVCECADLCRSSTTTVMHISHFKDKI